MNDIALVESRMVGGYLRDLRQPALIAILRVDKASLEQLPLEEIAAGLATHLPALAGREARERNASDLGRFIAEVILALTQGAGMALFELPTLHCWDEGATARLQLVVPLPNTRNTAVARALGWLVQVLNRRITAPRGADLRMLGQLARSLRRQASEAGLTRRMLQAAFARDIPWLFFSENVYQFGWGVHGRLLDGTFTDRTPAIAARLARNKASAAQVMRQAGLPVAPHRFVTSADDAARRAEVFGWPVVVKPADLDGGRGVAAGLNTVGAVRRAYEQARKLSSRILVEKHIAGKDYRVVLLDGAVVGVWERTPGSVTGDGKHNVRELLATVNADPIRQPAAQRRKQIALDAEAFELLAEQGLSVDAVPAAGRFVRLRRTANIGTGGSADKIPPEGVHPDNKLLCERAARLLRLDLAGVDLLIPDIGRSWREGGAAICEVNAQPQLASDMPPFILQALVPGNGRIPVAIVIDDGASAWLQDVLAALSNAGVHAGCVEGSEVSSGGHAVGSVGGNVAYGAQMLLCDPQVQVLLVTLQNVAQLRNGFPVDRCDLLVLAGGKDFRGEHASAARILDEGKPRVVVDPDSRLWDAWPMAEARTERVQNAKLGAHVTRLLLDMVARP